MDTFFTFYGIPRPKGWVLPTTTMLGPVPPAVHRIKTSNSYLYQLRRIIAWCDSVCASSTGRGLFLNERPSPLSPSHPPPDDMWSPGRSSYGRGRGPVPVFVASATRNSGPRIRSGDMGERLRSRDRVFFSFFFFFLLSTSIPLTCLPVWTGMRLIICLVSQLLS